MPDNWYLNLLARYPDGETKAKAGTQIQLAALPNLACRLATSPQVDWTVSYAGSPDSHHDYVVAPAFNATPTGLTNGKFRAQLDLPVVNGRTYTIEARRSAGNNTRLLQVQYTTCQRIYYSVHYMNNDCRDAFNAIKDQLHRIFEGFGVRLRSKHIVQCRKGGHDVNLEYTTTGSGVTLPHTWDEDEYPRSRAPNHIRMVVNRDLCNTIDGGVEWTMTNQTTADPTRRIRISSQGTNNGTVVYENDNTTFDETTPFSVLTVQCKLPPITAPLAAIGIANVYNPSESLAVDLAGDPSLAPILTRYNGGARLRITGTLRARRCEQGWVYGAAHELTATLSTDKTSSAPEVVGSAKLWIAGGDKLVIDDPRLFLTASDFAKNIEISFDSTTETLAGSTATRTSDNRMTLDLSGTQSITERLSASGEIAIKLQRCGALARGDDIGVPTDYNFDMGKIEKYQQRSVMDGELSACGSLGTKVTVRGNNLAIDGPGALTINFDNFSVPVPVPTVAISTTSPHHAEIDLSADPTLGPLATAIAQNVELTFKGKFNGRESMGGYSPTNERWFIALNTRALPGWDADIVSRRLLLTICHEVGHALGIVRQTVHNNSTATNENNARWYTDEHGGRGPHCHHNAHLVAAGAANGFPDTSSGQYYVHDPTAGGPLCIMYHAIDHDNIGDDFCDVCLEHLKRGVANFG